MIHYSLVCDAGHHFESWFRDSDAFDRQSAEGLINCPFCQSQTVGKAVMAPSVVGSAEERKGSSERQEVMLLDERHAQLRAMIRDLRERMIAGTEDVGDRFSQEARSMYDGEADLRPIRGQATLDEAKALIEDGIKILPIPDSPDGN